MTLHTQIRAALGTPPRVPDFYGNYGKDIEKNRRIRAWLDAIARDRNYARVLMGLPLIEPVSPAFRRWADDWRSRNA